MQIVVVKNPTPIKILQVQDNHIKMFLHRKVRMTFLKTNLNLLLTEVKVTLLVLIKICFILLQIKIKTTHLRILMVIWVRIAGQI